MPKSSKAPTSTDEIVTDHCTMDAEAMARAQLAQAQQQQQQGPSPAEQKRDMDEKKEQILTQILQPQAVDRMKRVRMVKPAQYEKVLEKLLHMAQSGAINSKVSEERLINIISEVGSTKMKITIARRPIDSESDEDYSDL